MSLLDDKYVTINSKVDCEGGRKLFYGLKIQDSHLGAGSISVKDALPPAVMWHLLNWRINIIIRNHQNLLRIYIISV